MSSTRTSHDITDLAPGDHLCWFYDTQEDHRAVITPFLRQGLERGEKVLYIVDAHPAETVLAYLREDGLDVELYLTRGQLSILTSADTYLGQGAFGPDAMVALLRSETARALAEGYQALRVTGEMSWATKGFPGSDRLIEYEAKLNTFFPESKCLAICQYDRRRFQPELLLDVLRTHPRAAIGTEVYDNFYYTPVSEVLEGRDAGLELCRWIRNLTQHKQAEEALQKEKMSSGSIIENMPAGIALLDNDFVLRKCNSAYADLIRTYTPYSPEQALGMSYFDYAPGSREQVEEWFVNVRDSGQAETRHGFRLALKRDGREEVTYWDTSIAPVFSAAGNVEGILILTQDVTERKRAEGALRESEERFREVSSSITDIAYSCSRRADGNYAIDWMTGAAGPITGYAIEEIQALGSWGRLVLEEDRPLFEANVTGLAPGASGACELRLRTKDGGVAWVASYSRCVAPPQDPGHPRLFGALVDIAERKRVEEEIRSLARFPSENPNPILRVNQDGRILYANESSGPLLADWGCAAGGFAPPPWRDAVRESVASQSSRLADAECGGRIYSLFLAPVPDAGYVNLYGRDITDRKQAEEALRRSEENFRRSLDDSPLGVRIVTTEGETLYANRAILEIYGYDSIEELRTTPVKKRYTPESYAGFQIRKKKRQRGENVPSEYEISIVRRNGEVRHLQVFRKEVLWDGERQFQTIYQDITERKRAEEVRERLLAELGAKNREMEAFVYTVSHDLKAPLVSLDGFSSLLQKQYYNQLGEEGKHYLERIQANVAHMDALIRNLLELARIGGVVGPIEEIDVAVLLREVRDELAVRLEGAPAEVVVQEPLPTLRADRGRIHQVFANLTDNAVKFRSAERALRIEVGCRQEGDVYRFHVTDNGIGIASQYHEQIFVPFQKLYPEIEGVGMGLALVKKIVEHHGGRIWVASEAGKGSTFYFTIPRG